MHRKLQLRARHGAAIDFLVIFTALVLLSIWLAGQFYLTLYPVSESGETAGRIVAEGDSDAPAVAGPMGLSNQPGGRPSNSALESGSLPDPAMATMADNSSQSAADDVQKVNVQKAVAKAEAEHQLRLDNLKLELNQAHSSQTELLNRQIEQLELKLSAALQNNERVSSDSVFTPPKDFNDPKMAADQQAEVDELNRQLSDFQTKIAEHQNEIRSKDEILLTREQQIQKLTDKLAQKEESVSSNAMQLLPEPKAKLVFREYESNGGGKAVLAFVQWKNNKIVFRDKENNEYELPLERLAPSEHAYLKSLK